MRRVGEGRAHPALVAVACAAVLLVAAVPAVSDDETVSFHYPRPTGPFPVGTRFLFLEDSGRLDAFSKHPGSHRWISTKVWYPATLPAAATPCPYAETGFEERLVKEGFFAPDFIAEVARRPSASFRDVPLAHQDSPWPVLLFSCSGVMTANVMLYEELASHGYVVVAVGHPYWSEFYFHGDGTSFELDKSNPHYLQLWKEENSKDVIDTKARITRSNDSAERLVLYRRLNTLMPTEAADLDLWHGDIDFLIDELEKLNRTESPYRGRLDLDRIGVLGYSKGGALASQICATRSRVKAGVNLGGFVFGGLVDGRLRRPFMTLEHVEPWAESSPPLFLPFLERSKCDAYNVDIEGGNHSTFTDLPVLRRYILPQGVLGPIDGARSALIVRSYVLAFLDSYVKGAPRSTLLDEVPSRFAEARFVRRVVQRTR